MRRVAPWGREDSRMTGSAYNAMDVLATCDSLFKGRGLGEGRQSDPTRPEAGG